MATWWFYLHIFSLKWNQVDRHEFNARFMCHVKHLTKNFSPVHCWASYRPAMQHFWWEYEADPRCTGEDYKHYFNNSWGNGSFHDRTILNVIVAFNVVGSSFCLDSSTCIFSQACWSVAERGRMRWHFVDEVEGGQLEVRGLRKWGWVFCYRNLYDIFVEVIIFPVWWMVYPI